MIKLIEKMIKLKFEFADHTIPAPRNQSGNREIPKSEGELNAQLITWVIGLR